MDQIQRISVNLQIREIASECCLKVKGSNDVLVQQLFKAKVEKLFAKELPAFQDAEPNFRDLIGWFWDFFNRKAFLKRVGC
jgi:hypothetical protein